MPPPVASMLIRVIHCTQCYEIIIFGFSVEEPRTFVGTKHNIERIVIPNVSSKVTSKLANIASCSVQPGLTASIMFTISPNTEEET